MPRKYTVTNPARLREKHFMRLVEVLDKAPYKNIKCPAVEQYDDGEFAQIIFDAKFDFLEQSFLVAFKLDSGYAGGMNYVRERRKRAAAKELGLPLIWLSRHATAEEVRIELIKGVMVILRDKVIGSGILD